jgi:hypothetical protein
MVDYETGPTKALIRETSQPGIREWAEKVKSESKKGTREHRDKLVSAFKGKAEAVLGSTAGEILAKHLEDVLSDGGNLFLHGVDEAASAVEDSRKSYSVTQLKQLKKEKDDTAKLIDGFTLQYNTLLDTQRKLLIDATNDIQLKNVLTVVKHGSMNMHTMLRNAANRIRDNATFNNFLLEDTKPG